MSGLSRRGVLQAGAIGSALLAGRAFASPLDGERVLPPEVDSAAFATAVRELRAIVGEGWVFADPESTISYRKSFIPDPAGRQVPSGAVAPASVEEVQAILRVANKYRL